ncbi:uncharacterized protein LOC135376445 [Ornithodoros turicata]|uniref:uncharacterized protein LOC135376445 n=1 Tax=Ornithodoros turicata TaxID=34597 RepID=UPI0031399A87
MACHPSVESPAYRERLLVTAQARHEHIKTLTVDEALRVYPFLKDEHTLLLEFEVLYQRNLLPLLEEGFQRLVELIKEHGSEDEVLLITESMEDTSEVGLKIIAARCKEELSIFITENEDMTLSPVLRRQDGSISLFVDAERVCDCSSMLLGLSSLFSAYWIFNVRYPKKGADTLTFIERAVLKLSVTKPRSKCVDLLHFFHALDK